MLNGRVVQRTHRKAGDTLGAQIFQQVDGFLGQICFALPADDLHMGVRQLRLRLPDPLSHLCEKLVIPVRHQDAKLDRLERILHLLLVGLPGRHISGIPDSIQNPLPDVRAHIGTVIQNTVNSTPGYSRQIRDHLDGGFLAHKGPPYICAFLKKHTLIVAHFRAVVNP